MKNIIFTAVAFAFTSQSFAAEADSAIGQHVTPVQANESRVIYLYDGAAAHASCQGHKRAAAFYMSAGQAEKLADGCWIDKGEQITFRLYADSGMALVTEVPRREVKFN